MSAKESMSGTIGVLDETILRCRIIDFSSRFQHLCRTVCHKIEGVCFKIKEISPCLVEYF